MAFYDETNDARERATANDVLLTDNPEQASTYFYIGGLEKFSEIYIKIGTARNDGVVGLNWEYWTGSWSTLTQTGGLYLNSTGWHTIKISPGASWTTTTINSQGPYYYVRVVWNGWSTVQAKADYINLDGPDYIPYEATGTVSGDFTITATWLKDPQG